MAFDYKKEYKEFYMPKNVPQKVTILKMNYIAVRGSRNPNDEDGLFMDSLASYCYGRSEEDKYKLMIDTVAADVVKKICM